MKFTSGVVREIAEAAGELTGGAFRFGYVSSPGDGVRYVDGIRQLVWFGRDAARQAAAYYTGGAVRWAAETGTEVPQVIANAAAVLSVDEGSRAVRKAYAAGKADAAARFEVRSPAQG